ncbi:MAG TPA: endolytic transglycosylase MltG [Polyangiaceae bacterium]
MRRAVLLVAALLAVAASVGFFVVYPSERGPGDGRAVELVAPANPSPQDLADLLAASGLLSQPRLFALWVRATGGTRGVVPGAHLLTDDATPGELLARLERRPGGGTARVTFPEGWNRFDMAKRLQDRHVVSLRDFLDATTDGALLRELGIEGDSAEGFLFPATYELSLDDDAKDVVRRMKREFDRRWDLASSAHGAALSDVMASAKMSARDVVILASIVEKEAAVDDERPLIASVFLNRMRDPSFKPKRLESDPTAAYGCLVAPERAPSCVTFSGKPTAAIEHDPGNPYSTYTHEGFPPGPIANAGYKSLEAAMAPATSRFYFFVARGEGRHTFSETYEAHAAAVRDGGAKPAVK